MANWTVSASTAAETVQAQAFARMAFTEAKTKMFWDPMIGESPNSFIQKDTRLMKEQGDVVNFSLVTHPSGDGVGNDGTLEGYEISPSTYSSSVKLFEIAQAIKLNGRMTEQRSSIDLRYHQKDELAYWYSRWHDGAIFKKLSGTTVADKDSNTLGEAGATNSNIIYGGGVAALNELTVESTLTLDDISNAKVAAQTGVFGSTTIYKMRPALVDGQEYYMLVAHPYSIRDIKKTQEWKDAVQMAEIRGKDNPLFTGAVAIWDNVIIKTHDLVQTGSDAGEGSNIDYATNLFLGAQAGIVAYAQEAPNWVEISRDYMRKHGLGTSMVMGVNKCRFNSIDFSVIAIKTAAKNPLKLVA